MKSPISKSNKKTDRLTKEVLYKKFDAMRNGSYDKRRNTRANPSSGLAKLSTLNTKNTKNSKKEPKSMSRNVKMSSSKKSGLPDYELPGSDIGMNKPNECPPAMKHIVMQTASQQISQTNYRSHPQIPQMNTEESKEVRVHEETKGTRFINDTAESLHQSPSASEFHTANQEQPDESGFDSNNMSLPEMDNEIMMPQIQNHIVATGNFVCHSFKSRPTSISRFPVAQNQQTPVRIPEFCTLRGME